MERVFLLEEHSPQVQVLLKVHPQVLRVGSVSSSPHCSPLLLVHLQAAQVFHTTHLDSQQPLQRLLVHLQVQPPLPLVRPQVPLQVVLVEVAEVVLVVRVVAWCLIHEFV